MTNILLKNQFTGNLPDAPEGHSRLMTNENGALVLIDQVFIDDVNYEAL